MNKIGEKTNMEKAAPLDLQTQQKNYLRKPQLRLTTLIGAAALWLGHVVIH